MTYKKKFRKSAIKDRGCGHITWPRFAAMLRACGLLLDGQHLEGVEVSDKGIAFTTDNIDNHRMPQKKETG